MMHCTYLAVLLFSFAGMATLDYRHKLAFFHNRRRTLITLAVGVAVFTVWDIAGVALGIFFTGNSPYITGVMLGPEYPLEELVFLTFLCYFTLVIYRLLEEKWPRT